MINVTAAGSRRLLKASCMPAVSPLVPVSLQICQCRRASSTTSASTAAAAPAYPGHISINAFQRGLLAVGSAVASLYNPYRHDMVAVLGETTAGRQLPKMREQLLKGDAEGRRLLKERPRLRSDTIDIEQLKLLPDGSFGRAYVDWLSACGVSPDTRDPVSAVASPLSAQADTSPQGSIHRRPRASVHYAALPRMSRLLPRRTRLSSLRQRRACRQVVRNGKYGTACSISQLLLWPTTTQGRQTASAS